MSNRNYNTNFIVVVGHTEKGKKWFDLNVLNHGFTKCVVHKGQTFNDYCTIYLSIGCHRETSRSERTLVGRRWGNHGARIRNIKFYISAVTSRYLRQQWSTISAAAADSQQTLDLDVSVKTSGCLFVLLSVAERVVNRGQHLAAPTVTVCRSDISDHLSAGRLFSVEKVR